MVAFPWALLAPPANISTTEWVDEGHIVLSQRESAVPGVLSLDYTPYVRGMLDLIDQPHVRAAWLMKCVQGAGSQAARLYLAARMDLDPAPALIVFPNEQSARETIEERVQPMFQNSARLSRYVSGRKSDMTRAHLKLTHADVFIGWAGSPQALASRPIGILILDETDKYPAYRGVETDPISLGLARLTTYLRSKAFGLSTPTIPTGPISQRFKAAGCRYHFCPTCQGCGEAMKPEFDQVCFDGKEAQDPDDIAASLAALAAGDEAATYACQHCDHEHSDRDYKRGVKQGRWVPDGDPRSPEIAFHLHGLVSPFPKMGVNGLAAAYLRAQLDGLQGMQNFFNNFLGLPFWDESIHGDAETQVGAATVWRKARGEPGVVPRWATTLVAGADSKRRGHYYVVRAFGPGWRSQLIDYGETSTSEELTERVFRDWPKEKGGTARVRMMCVDTGGGLGSRDKSRTDELYRYCKTDSAHIKAVRGYGGGGSPSQPVVTSNQQYVPPGGQRMPYDITVSTLDTEYFKDLLAARINDTEDPDLWLACVGVDQNYVLQLSSERKILVERRIKHGESRDIWRWVPRTSNAANHLWDSEVYALAAAYMLDIDKIEEGQERRRRRSRKGSGGRMGWATGYRS